MTYFNCCVYPDEFGTTMEETCEIIVRADTFQHLIEKMGKIMNPNHHYDRFVLRYMASNENGCYVLNVWGLNSNEFNGLIRRNFNV